MNDDSKKIFSLIYDDINWKCWVNSSSKSDSPPDYYCDEFKLMMEIMRVDDHAYSIDKKGTTKIINKVTAREEELYKEVIKSGLIDSFPNVKVITTASLPDIPTRDFCNYDRYVENFTRIVNKHKESIPLYKENHPGYKLIFFIMDESESYEEVDTEEIANKEIPVGTEIPGELHYPFLDYKFIKPLINSGIDFLIWLMPNKMIETSDLGFISLIPRICVIDISEIKLYLNKLRKYDRKRMICVNG